MDHRSHVMDFLLGGDPGSSVEWFAEYLAFLQDGDAEVRTVVELAHEMMADLVLEERIAGEGEALARSLDLAIPGVPGFAQLLAAALYLRARQLVASPERSRLLEPRKRLAEAQAEIRKHVTSDFVNELAHGVHQRARRSDLFATALRRSATELTAILPTLETFAHRGPGVALGDGPTLPDFGRAALRRGCTICRVDSDGRRHCSSAPCGLVVVIIIVIVVTRRLVQE